MKIKTAIMGAGFMGRIHGINLHRHADTAVTAVCDADRNTAQALANQCQAKVYTDYETMLDIEKPDAVIICLPPFAHHNEVTLAAERHIHVFIEKPIALTPAMAYEAVKSALSTNIKTQVGYHYRFGKAVNALKQLINTGEAGRPVLFNGRYACNALHGAWWREKDKCGSQIVEQAIHLYDMCLHLLGAPLSVYGAVDNLCHRKVDRYTIEDVSASLMRYKNGAIGVVTATNCAIPNRWLDPFTVVFENITAEFTNPNQATFTFTQDKKPREQIITAEHDMYADEMAAFIRLVKGECTQSCCAIEEGFESLYLADAVIQSANGGGVIHFTGGLSWENVSSS